MLQLFASARAFTDATNETKRNALCVRLIPASQVEAFAAHLSHADAQRIARTALLVRNAERLPILAQALRAERSATPANRVSKPRANRVSKRVLSRHDACEALKRAARDFLIHPTRTNELRTALRACAEAHSLTLPNPRLRKRNTDADPCLVHDAALDCGYSPTPENFANSISTLLRYEITLLAQHDAQPARLMHPTVRAPEPPAPVIHRAPSGSLDWSTQPIIGIDPAVLAEQAQYLTNKRDLIANLAAKRAKRIEPKKRRANKPANRVSKPSPKWNARLGKEVLTLRR